MTRLCCKRSSAADAVVVLLLVLSLSFSFSLMAAAMAVVPVCGDGGVSTAATLHLDHHPTTTTTFTTLARSPSLQGGIPSPPGLSFHVALVLPVSRRGSFSSALRRNVLHTHLKGGLCSRRNG